MSKSMSSLRIERLNRLLGVLKSEDYISREALMIECAYVSGRTLESDIRFLRESFGAKIRFSRRNMAYHLEDTGKYILAGAKHA